MSDLGTLKLLDFSTIETVLVAAKVIKKVATVYRPNKVIIKVVKFAKAFVNIIIIDFSLVKAKVITEVVVIEFSLIKAKTILKAVIKYSFVVPDLYWLRSRLYRPL